MNLPDYYSPSKYEDYVCRRGDYYDYESEWEREMEIEAEKADMYDEEDEEC